MAFMSGLQCCLSLFLCGFLKDCVSSEGSGVGHLLLVGEGCSSGSFDKACSMMEGSSAEKTPSMKFISIVSKSKNE